MKDLGSSLASSAKGGVEAGRAVDKGRRAEGATLVERFQVVCIVETGSTVIQAITGQAVVHMT